MDINRFYRPFTAAVWFSFLSIWVIFGVTLYLLSLISRKLAGTKIDGAGNDAVNDAIHVAGNDAGNGAGHGTGNGAGNGPGIVTEEEFTLFGQRPQRTDVL